jgi:O-antigen/teichoic acid export membrane protein
VNAVRLSLWISLADSYLGLVLRIVSTAVISRLLSPKEIGVLAVAAVFSNLASMFRDFGVAEYMIQEKDLTREKIAATLALNIVVSWSMGLAMFLGAPYAASFYSDPGVGEVMRLQAVCFLLVPFGAVTMAYFRRELNFKPVLLCNIAGNITGFVVAVLLAYLGFSYMSLAWASLASMLVTVLGSMWYRPKDFPRWPSLKAVGEVFHFSKFASSMYMFAQLGKGAPEMIIGRVQGMVDVAMFSRGNGLIEMFQRLALRPVLFVCMPYFAKSDREDGEIAQAYVKSVMYITAVGWPFLAFTAIAAYPAIRIVYGPQWDAAVPIAQILAAAFALELVHAMSREAMLARGDAKGANNLQIIIVVLQVLGLAPVLHFGITGAAWGTLVASGLGVVVSQIYLKRCFGLRTRDMLWACWPSLLLTAGACAPGAAWALWAGVGAHNYVVFGLVGGALTAAAWLLTLKLTGHPLMAEVSSTAHRLLVRFKLR